MPIQRQPKLCASVLWLCRCILNRLENLLQPSSECFTQWSQILPEQYPHRASCWRLMKKIAGEKALQIKVAELRGAYNALSNISLTPNAKLYKKMIISLKIHRAKQSSTLDRSSLPCHTRASGSQRDLADFVLECNACLIGLGEGAPHQGQGLIRFVYLQTTEELSAPENALFCLGSPVRPIFSSVSAFFPKQVPLSSNQCLPNLGPPGIQNPASSPCPLTHPLCVNLAPTPPRQG